MNIRTTKLALALLLSMPCLQANPTTGQSFYFGHQQVGTMVDVFGWNNQINLFNNEECKAVIKIQTEGGTSFSNTKLAQYFTSNGTNTMIFGPSYDATTEQFTDVSGINFLLSESFQSTVVFSPSLTTWVTDIAAFVDLSNWVENLHIRAHLPIQYLKQTLKLTETITANGSTTYTAGDLSNVTPAVAYTSVKEAFASGKTAGDVLQAWNYGTISGSQDSTEVTDITLSVGYNFINKEHSHLGLEVGGTFGAGRKSTAKYVFEPTFGNLGRSGVFGVFDSHTVLWDGEDQHQFAAWVNAKVGYIFSGDQIRSYDLTDFGVWSRYMLVKKFSSVGTSGNTVFAGVDNMINVGTLQAKIGNYVTFDMSLLFDWQYDNFDFQIGWELGGHSAEKHKVFIDTIPANTYIIHVPGVAGAAIDEAIGNADAQTANGAELLPGNFNVNGDITVTPTLQELTQATQTTVALSNAALNTDSALAGTAISNAVVMGFNYTWRDHDFVPSIGIYGKGEFDGYHHNTADLFTVGLQGNVTF